MFDQIAKLYEELLFRTASQAEVEFWARQGSIDHIRECISNSEERGSKVTQITAGAREFALATDDMDASDASWLRQHTAGSLDQWGVLLKQIRGGDVVLDIGAHRGSFAVQAAAVGAVVLAVEAGTRNSELLRRTAKMNMALDIRVYQCAAWHEKTTLRFTENNAWGSVTPTGVSQVPAERVDDIVSDLIDRVTCVKMDVEGAEPQAVRGMPKLLERDIDILYETNSHSLHAAGTTTQALQKQFTDAGFTNYLYHNGCLYLLAEEDTQPTTVMDCFATRRDPRRLGVRVSGRIPNDVMSAEMLRYVNYPESTKHVQRELARRPDLRTHALTNAIKHG